MAICFSVPLTTVKRTEPYAKHFWTEEPNIWSNWPSAKYRSMWQHPLLMLRVSCNVRTVTVKVTTSDRKQRHIPWLCSATLPVHGSMATVKYTNRKCLGYRVDSPGFYSRQRQRI